MSVFVCQLNMDLLCSAAGPVKFGLSRPPRDIIIRPPRDVIAKAIYGSCSGTKNNALDLCIQ